MKSPIRNTTSSIKEFFTFNYAERRGIMVLVVMIMLTESVNALLPRFIQQEEADMSAFEKEVRQFEAALARADSLDKIKKIDTEKKQFPVQATYKKKAFAERPPLIVEVNTADSTQLIKLYGIGPGFARRILTYRAMLGGFFSASQLLEVFGMDTSRLNGFIENISIDTNAIDKINVNEADFKTLLRHPYLDYETVRLIFNYREYIGPILNADSLRKVIAYDPMWEAVRPYIEYGIPSNIHQTPNTGQQAPNMEP
jgi:DNA uptake protein ComE-like DNA-binding protein